MLMLGAWVKGCHTTPYTFVGLGAEKGDKDEGEEGRKDLITSSREGAGDRGKHK